MCQGAQEHAGGLSLLPASSHSCLMPCPSACALQVNIQCICASAPAKLSSYRCIYHLCVQGVLFLSLAGTCPVEHVQIVCDE